MSIPRSIGWALVWGACHPRPAHAAPVFAPEVFDRLDVGLYWFGPDEITQKADGTWPHPYFDPDRPILIYVHGWERDTTPRRFREAYDWSEDGGPDLYLAQGWLDAGWNVGVFYWNQLADEPRVGDAEAKIWSATGPKGMRWRDAAGEYHDDGPTVAAHQLFVQHYRDALAPYRGDGIRIVGHSLGNQMAIALIDGILDGVASGSMDAGLIPDRLVLLDPYYGSGAQPYLGDRWTGEVARGMVDRAHDAGILIEIHRSSVLSRIPLIGDANPGLYDRAAVVRIRPRHLPLLAVVDKHIAAPWHYFWSISFPPPTISGSDEVGLSASTGADRVRALMDGAWTLDHREGTRTPTPGDDVFRTRRR